MDGIVISSLISELRGKIFGSAINKIHQPESYEIILSIGKNKLLLSANPSCPRVNLTMRNKISAQNPQRFCMVLRKHIQNARIINIIQPNFDRIIIFEIKAVNGIGDTAFYKLIVEIMGKHSNIILIDDKNLIVDAIKHITPEKSSVRQILPNVKYEMPPNKNKLDPTKISDEQFFSCGEPLYKFLNGISPVVSEEIAADKNIFFEIRRVIANENYVNEIIFDEKNKPIILSAIDLKKYDKKLKYTSISQAIEDFYAEKNKIQTGDLQKIILNNIARCEKKIKLQSQTLDQTKNKDMLKLCGELLMANAYQIPKGCDSFVAENYYDNNSKMEIKLDKNLTAVENAQVYFKKYNRQKRTQVAVIEQLDKNNAQLKYLETVLQNLRLCQNKADLDEIRFELYQQKILHKPKKSKQIQKSLPLHFVSSDGFDIYVGKNNIQNDFLTFKFARPNDFWLHVKNIPGSHVIIKCEKNDVNEKTLKEAANICAFYSKAFESSNVAVDYTKRKFVKKTSGAKPGMVIYENYKTIFASPNQKLIEELKKDD